MNADGWQPIDSAPKDGTDVLIYHQSRTSDSIIVIAQWTDDGMDSYHWCDAVAIYEPTHWQPLPDPPEAKS